MFGFFVALSIELTSTTGTGYNASLGGISSFFIFMLQGQRLL
jgi:hypothetical protein